MTPRRSGAAVTQAIVTVMLPPAALLTLWFLIPLGSFGPDNPTLSWLAFSAALVALAGVLLREIRREILNEPGHPALVIVFLLSSALVVFATAYLGLAKRPGELSGVSTKVDALYFTVITMSTVGYGDIVPVGQAARVVVMLQILYTLVFLTAGFTALTRTIRSRVAGRIGAEPPP
ncbi:potassium channel family protein [Kitasatospora sp. NPDC048365]|uniref:potassium channel family protein n=1 Tax=Kitasatospora sp. NPDC048365 TaxID=3364050 RepID=UPI003714BE4E